MFTAFLANIVFLIICFKPYLYLEGFPVLSSNKNINLNGYPVLFIHNCFELCSLNSGWGHNCVQWFRAKKVTNIVN